MSTYFYCEAKDWISAIERNGGCGGGGGESDDWGKSDGLTSIVCVVIAYIVKREKDEMIKRDT